MQMNTKQYAPQVRPTTKTHMDSTLNDYVH